MTLIERSRTLAEWQPISYAGRSRKVRNGVTGWERWVCVFCAVETLKHHHTEIQHASDCRWVTTMPRIVAALEVADWLIEAQDRADCGDESEQAFAALATALRGEVVPALGNGSV